MYNSLRQPANLFSAVGLLRLSVYCLPCLCLLACLFVLIPKYQWQMGTLQKARRVEAKYNCFIRRVEADTVQLLILIERKGYIKPRNEKKVKRQKSRECRGGDDMNYWYEKVISQ